MTLPETGRVLVLTSFPPRVCGIATYTQDLLSALRRVYGNSMQFRVCALEMGSVNRRYPAEVDYTLDILSQASYVDLARHINDDPLIDQLWIQHEFGLYAGGNGQYLLDLVRSVQKPVTITFHTVLAHPSPGQQQMVQALAAKAREVIVLTERSAEILDRTYGIPSAKVQVIPHGTHVIANGDTSVMKRKLGLEGRMVLSNFGLLSRNKAIETAIEAMPTIVRAEPRALYLVLGRTHPEIIKQECERYRDTLQARVEELGLSKHVLFVNHYLELHELLDYLCATDVYLFTSKDPQQAVSGTFAYALGCGCPVISTRIPHAEAKLGDAGILIDFNSPAQLAEATVKLLKDDGLRSQMGKNALHRMSANSWENVAIAHLRAFIRNTPGRAKPTFKAPMVKLAHLRRMTTSLGMVQFSNITTPDLTSGHTVDDNARALIAVAMLPAVTGKEENTLARTYLDFLAHCQQPDGSFLNYTDQHGRFTSQNSEVNLDDPNGRAIWALGTVVATMELDDTLRNRAAQILRNALPFAAQVRSPRAIAFIMKGLYAYNTVRKDQRIRAMIDRLGSRLLVGVGAHFSKDWQWIEPEVTYGNAVIPEALLIGFLATRDELYRDTALATMNFLLERTFHEGGFQGVTNRSWMDKDGHGVQFGEQPIEAAYTMLALERFMEAFGDEDYRSYMQTAFNWFLGENHLHQTIYDRVSGGCRDGLEEHNVSLNQGAESTLCYLIARLVAQRTLQPRSSRKITKRTPLRRTSPHSPYAAGRGLPYSNPKA